MIKYETCQVFYHFRTKLGKFNNTKERKSDAIHHMALDLLGNHVFLRAILKILLHCYDCHDRHYIMLLNM